MECISQQFSNSSEVSKAKDFLQDLESLPSMNIANKAEYPFLLLSCGENNLFNQRNRGYKITKIREGSLSDKILSSLTKIQSKQWCIFNPSHKPYSGKLVKKFVENFHKSASKDKRIKYIITGNNRKCSIFNPGINRPLLWKDGTSSEMETVYKDRADRLYMYFFQL